MVRIKKRRSFKQIICSPIEIESIPIGEMRKLIDCGAIECELPFDLIAETFPPLLADWYPGYPAAPRQMTPVDPFPTRGRIENNLLTIEGMPGEQIRLGGAVDLCGEFDIWLRCDEKGQFSAYVVHGEDEP